GDRRGCEAICRPITPVYQDGTAQRRLIKWIGDSGLELTQSVPQFEDCNGVNPATPNARDRTRRQATSPARVSRGGNHCALRTSRSDAAEGAPAPDAQRRGLVLP